MPKAQDNIQTTEPKKKVTKRKTPKKNLVIVESPSKAKTIGKYLGSRYKVVASVGHVRDLPKSKMGIDVEHDYAPHYISIRGKGEIIKELKREAKKANKVFLASDPDREGEAIAWHLSYLLGLDPNDKNRVVFNEITKDAVKNAFKTPRSINMDLVDAQQARRVLDRLVGYSISPLLWQKIKRGLSAGRVQSVALNLIMEREREIKAFKPEEYWTLGATVSTDQEAFEAEFVGLGDEKQELKNNEDVQNILSKLSATEPLTVTSVEKKERIRMPSAPFTTSTMQQVANNTLKFKTQKTMMVAQQLYEGINIGRHTVGLITYMRTDSTRISDVAKAEAAGYIEETFGKDYLGSKVKPVKLAEGAQDAHEGIRPTSTLRTPESLEKYLDKDQMKLYKLIWSRFVASQMAPAVSDTVTVGLNQNDVTFKAHGSHLKFKGFMEVYKEATAKNNILPELIVGDEIAIEKLSPNQHFTLPPARYSEATLIKTLESNGVGRPSTYAPTLSTIQKRYYVKLNSRRFEPTELGEIVNKITEEFFPDILNVEFTAHLEEQLDNIEAGKLEWIKVIDQFYQPFSKEITAAETKLQKVRIKDEPADQDCDICGAPMVIKIGRYGKFIACSRFPECRNTKAIVKEIGITCPICHKGQVVERKSKTNRLFYGCSLYPECEFVSWDKPVGRDCPKCGHFLVEKKSRKGTQVVCPEGDYEEEIIK